MPQTETVLVAAASSLTDVLKAIAPGFTRATGIAVRFTFGASGTLQRQIEAGAPIDVFVSAGRRETDALGPRLAPGTLQLVAANRLVLIVNPTATSAIITWADLAKPDVRRVALSQPASVPSGRYAKETLEKRNLWAQVTQKAVYGQNVRQTLAYVASGDADAGIVFQTDALTEKRVRVVATAVPGQDHTPIVYPAAVVARTRNAAAARRFVTYLTSKDAQAVFARFGFLPPR